MVAFYLKTLLDRYLYAQTTFNLWLTFLEGECIFFLSINKKIGKTMKKITYLLLLSFTPV